MALTPLKILHTSDIHLTHTIRPKGEETPPQLGLMAVVDSANYLDVDLLLVAGDLFDHNRVPAETIDFAFEHLNRVNCPVVMVSGNHDCQAPDSVYYRLEEATIGDHVHMLLDESGEVRSLPELGVTMWGRGIVDHHPGNRPLEYIPAKATDDWYIGISHGYFVERGPEYYSSLITADEIADSTLDYLALGHVHAYAEISQGPTCAAYSGTPDVHPNMPNGTVAHVTLDPTAGVSVQGLLVADILEEADAVGRGGLKEAVYAD